MEGECRQMTACWEFHTRGMHVCTSISTYIYTHYIYVHRYICTQSICPRLWNLNSFCPHKKGRKCSVCAFPLWWSLDFPLLWSYSWSGATLDEKRQCNSSRTIRAWKFGGISGVWVSSIQLEQAKQKIQTVWRTPLPSGVLTDYQQWCRYYSSLVFFSPGCTLLPYLWGQNIYCRCITQGCLSTVLLLYSGVSPAKSQTMKAWCYWNEMEMKQQQTACIAPLCPATFANTDLEKGANASRGLQIHKGLQASAVPFRQVFCPTLWMFFVCWNHCLCNETTELHLWAGKSSYAGPKTVYFFQVPRMILE